jgi:hypothetical protein
MTSISLSVRISKRAKKIFAGVLTSRGQYSIEYALSDVVIAV